MSAPFSQAYLAHRFLETNKPSRMQDKTRDFGASSFWLVGSVLLGEGLETPLSAQQFHFRECEGESCVVGLARGAVGLSVLRGDGGNVLGEMI